MGNSTRSKIWSVRPGYAFSAGAGFGAGVYVFDFLNWQDATIYGMLFGGAGLAGSPLGLFKGIPTTAAALGQGLGKQALLKALGVGYGTATNSGVAVGQQFTNRKWTEIPVNLPFSANDLNNSSGRVTILGASAAKVGYYACYVSGSPWVKLGVLPDFFSSASVDVLPQNFDLQVASTIGMWFNVYDYPNDGN